MKKIGVFVCHCGSNISDVVDIDRTLDALRGMEGVHVLKSTMFACSDSAQNEIIQDIQNEGLEGLVVASCSPKLHVPTFRDVARRAGLNPYRYVQVNIREQSSWAHSDQPGPATEKAIRLIRAGITRVRYARALDPIRIKAENAVAIVGAGITGMRTAMGLAALGTKVTLLERDHFIGGRVPLWGFLTGSETTGTELADKLYHKLQGLANVEIFTGAEIENVNGSVGDFTLNFNVRPRYINPETDPGRIKELVDACPVEIPDPYGLHKANIPAVYFKYPGANPGIPVADMNALGDRKSYLEQFSDCLEPGQKVKQHRIRIGAVILATGIDPYKPEDGEFSYGHHSSIITLDELRIEMSRNGSIGSWNGKRVNQIAFIYCVGSCQVYGNNKYCSRICCTTTLDTSLQIRKANPEVQCIHLYRQMRTYGKQELIYEEACRNGDLFMKFDDDDPPEVTAEEGGISVRVRDQLTMGMELEIRPDLLVLVTGMVPSKGYEKTAEIFKAPLGRDLFFNEVHPKLRPVETVIDGIYIAGAGQGPKNISESVKSGMSAVSKAHALLREGEIELDPTIASIDPEKCTWCDLCANICPFDAVKTESFNGKQVAAIEKASCKGCGMCNPVCPADAIDLIGYTNNEIEGMIESLISGES